MSPSSPASPLVFVHIQKTGGSAIKRALGYEAHGPNKHRMARELRDTLGKTVFDAGFKFAFVRNPWDRLVSWWSMIDASRPLRAEGGHLNAFFTYILDNATTFEEFIVNCREVIHDADGSKHIFRNQLDYITDTNGRILMDFVGRFEALSSDFARVQQFAGLTPVALPRVNVSEHAHYIDFYDSRLRKIVADAFAGDIETFGYRFGTQTPAISRTA